MLQQHWREVKKARQRLVLCRLMIDMMRTVHGAYAPANEPFGTRLETFFIALCVALGDIDGRPFSVAKINNEINAALADPTMKVRLADLGGIPIAGSPGDFGKLIADETEKWAKVIRRAGIRAE